MAQAKKRFRWRLLACSVLTGLLALAVGFIETVGRQGTIVGRYEQIKYGMSEADAVRILGNPTLDDGPLLPGLKGKTVFWKEGTVYVFLLFDNDRAFSKHLIEPPPENGEHVWWHVRRWAEQAYTAIHGTRH